VGLRALLHEEADAWSACVSHPGMLQHTSLTLSSVADPAYPSPHSARIRSDRSLAVTCAARADEEFLIIHPPA